MRNVFSILFRSDGTITIFAALVLASLLMFFAFLIDYARLALFHKYTEDISRTAVRSILSAYDKQLFEQYRLFGRGGSDATQLFELTVNNHQPDWQQNKQKFTLLNSQLQTVTISSNEQLGLHAVFGRQLLEEMKYKAPIDVAADLWKKWMPLSGKLRETATQVNQISELRKLYEWREQKLDKILQQQQFVAKQVVKSQVSQALNRSSSTNKKNILLVDVITKYNDYLNNLETQAALSEQASEQLDVQLFSQLAQQIDSYRQDVNAIITILTDQLSSSLTIHKEAIAKAKRWLTEAEKINNDIIAAEAKQNTMDTTHSQLAATELSTTKPDMISLARSTVYFEQYRAELQLQATSWESVVEDSNAMRQLLYQVLQSYPSSKSSLYAINGVLIKDELQSAMVKLQQSYNEYDHQFNAPGEVLLKREEDDEERSVKRQLQSNKQTANQMMKRVQSMMKTLSNLEITDEERQVFADVKRRYNNNIAFNQSKVEEEIPVEVDGNSLQPSKPFYGDVDADETAASSAGQIQKVYGSLENIVTNLQTRLYYGEYAALYFPSFAPEKLQSLIDLNNAQEQNNESLAITFSDQQLEYIIFGLDNPTGNVAAAYGEILAIRLMVRLMEGLVQYRSLTHPLLILSTALIYALEKTIEDMISLIKNGYTVMSKHLPIDVTYKDYLRLMLLAHPTADEVLLARMIAVIEQTTSLELAKIDTGIITEANYAVQLWFLPAVSQLVSYFSNWSGKVTGSTYEATKTIGWSY
ncbi:hypothetical protein ACFSTH_15665 [Paenibacillus yanchengensis]|uniref:Uncharacterized protein n=1 Tax=Paenibacillus yanchengensis TaxID=2035833 RepID=A0ABW4YFJ4_9BACL